MNLNRFLNQPSVVQNTRLILFSLLFLFSFLQFYKPLEMEDGWWHLATARWIVSHRAVPHEDIFPLNGEPAARWTYTQALGSLILYEVNAVMGDEGLRLLRALFLRG